MALGVMTGNTLSEDFILKSDVLVKSMVMEQNLPWGVDDKFTEDDTGYAKLWANQTDFRFACNKKGWNGHTGDTTDCNEVLGYSSGVCCFDIEGTPPTKSISEGNKFEQATLTSLNQAYPVLGGKKSVCAYDWTLQNTQGWMKDGYKKQEDENGVTYT